MYISVSGTWSNWFISDSLSLSPCHHPSADPTASVSDFHTWRGAAGKGPYLICRIRSATAPPSPAGSHSSSAAFSLPVNCVVYSPHPLGTHWPQDLFNQYFKPPLSWKSNSETSFLSCCFSFSPSSFFLPASISVKSNKWWLSEFLILAVRLPDLLTLSQLISLCTC